MDDDSHLSPPKFSGPSQFGPTLPWSLAVKALLHPVGRGDKYSGEGSHHFLPRGNINSQQDMMIFSKQMQLNSWRWPQFVSEDSPVCTKAWCHPLSYWVFPYQARQLRQSPHRHAHRLIWSFNWRLKLFFETSYWNNSSQLILDYVK